MASVFFNFATHTYINTTSLPELKSVHLCNWENELLRTEIYMRHPR